MNRCLKSSFVAKLLDGGFKVLGCDNLARLLAVSIGVASALPDLAHAEAFKTLYSFQYGDYGNVGLTARLAFLDGTIFGTRNVLFKLSSDGTDFSLFDELTIEHGYVVDELIAADGTLYGEHHDTNDVLFKVRTDGTGYQALHRFINDEGGGLAKLILSEGTLFGVGGGGRGNSGTIFRINSDGTGFEVLHSFSVPDSLNFFWQGGPFYTNADGGVPADLVLSGSALYGTTLTGGDTAAGTIFKIGTDGTGFTVLHSFAPRSGNFFNFDGPEGGHPERLIVAGNTLFGTTQQGASHLNGSIFKINTDGTGFTTLHHFTGPSLYIFDFNRTVTNLDGALPIGLAVVGSTLYGSAADGGNAGGGTVFSLNTDGSEFRTLYDFSGTLTNSDGYHTNSDGYGANTVSVSGDTLYGTTWLGGVGGGGTVFSISLNPQLTLEPIGSGMVLRWPTNFSGYILQSTIDLGSPAVWTNNLPAPVLVNGQYTVTNPISATQQFFRLSR
jgi:uncharacterized repeat protein (TIGR03803 family)